MRVRHLPAYGFVRQRWANGLGWTREVCRQPAAGEDWDWRASIAEIDQPGPFSPFPGCRRLLVLLEGSALRLQVDAAEHVLQPPYGRIGFDGAAAVRCELLDGPVRAFNVIHRPGIEASILPRPLVGPMVFFAGPGESWLLYLVRGECALKPPHAPLRLAAGDAWLLDGDDAEPRRAIVDGGGELLLVSVRRVPAP